jgi:hypothetical protein
MAAPAQPAQPAQTTLQVPLYADFVGIRTTALGAPRVRLLDAAGAVRADVTAPGTRPAGGQWYVSLGAPNQGAASVLIRPGDRLEVTVDGRFTALVVPAMSATVDAQTDVVTGRVPDGTAGVLVALQAAEGWADPVRPPDPVATGVGAGGRFELDLSARFDFRPGTWGQAAITDGAGHLVVVPFAPPAVIVYPAAHVAVIQCDPTAAPVLRVTNPLGTDLFRSTRPLSPSGSAAPRFTVTLAHDGDPVRPFDLRLGQQVVLELSGQPGVTATMPWITATIDPASLSVSGFAPPEARTVISVQPEVSQGGTPAPSVTVVTRSNAQGAYRAALADTTLQASAQATVVAYPEGGVAFATQGLVPSQAVLLYGDVLQAVLAGWGEVSIEQRAADGALLARGSAPTDAVGRLAAQLLKPGGERATIAPGDRLILTPEKGAVLDLTVPRVTATADAARRTLQGEAPPDARLVAAVFSEPPEYFDPRPYERPYETLNGRSDAAGRFTLRCQTAGCAMRYGVLVAYQGSAGFTLQWLDAPLVGVAVTLNSIIGRATAGERVTVTPLDAAGRPGTPLSDLVRPLAPGAFPEWEADLTALFPGGLQPGDRLQIDVGDVGHDVLVPAFTWRADVARNLVAGTGPAGRLVGVIAVPYGDPSRPYTGNAQTIVGLDGRWQARFAGFNLKPGDDLYLLLPQEGLFLYWIEESIQGDEPATPTPTSPPTASPAPSRPRIYLPTVSRAASVVADP